MSIISTIGIDNSRSRKERKPKSQELKCSEAERQKTEKLPKKFKKGYW